MCGATQNEISLVCVAEAAVGFSTDCARSVSIGFSTRPVNSSGIASTPASAFGTIGIS
jgi:hypothetical protein